MTFNRSLTDRVTDTFTAPRWVHYLFKMGVGVLVLVNVVFLMVFASAAHQISLQIMLAAAVLSVAWLLTTKVAARLERGSKWNAIGPDLACDLSLHVFPVAVLLLLNHQLVTGLVLGVLCFIVWTLTYPNASP